MTIMTGIINYLNSLKNYAFFGQFCMDIMMGVVREDSLPNYFGSTWSRATNTEAHASTERACQSKW